MMRKQREIKFRAWDKQEKKWVEDFGIEANTGLMFRNEANYLPFISSAWVGDLSFKEYQDKNYVVMQYTGLKDKNGVEIYEGDILDGGEFIARNLFHNNLGLVDLPLKERWVGVSADLEEREVIGNVYDNPELEEVS